MTLKTVKDVPSRAISQLEYDDEAETCAVQFRDGTTILLQNFPLDVFEEWMMARSIGQYWNYELRGRY